MSEIDIQELIDMNHRVITLLGIATSLLMECKVTRPKYEHYKFDWFLQALDDVVYLKKSLPLLPVDREGK